MNDDADNKASFQHCDLPKLQTRTMFVYQVQPSPEMEEPVPVEIPAFLLEPEVIETAEEPEAEIISEPEVIEEPVPEIDAPEPEPEPMLPDPDPVETVPEALLDLVRENEPYGETQTRLWELYLELNGKLMLGLATEEDARLHTRLHGHLAWISKGAAEVVT